MEPKDIENPIAERDFIFQQKAIFKARAFYKKEKGYCDEQMEGVLSSTFDIMAKYADQKYIKGMEDGIWGAVEACTESKYCKSVTAFYSIRDELILNL